MRYFVLCCVGGTELLKYGPFKKADTRDRRAREIRNRSDDNTCFALDVHPNGRVMVSSYSAGFMLGDD